MTGRKEHALPGFTHINTDTVYSHSGVKSFVTKVVSVTVEKLKTNSTFVVEAKPQILKHIKRMIFTNFTAAAYQSFQPAGFCTPRAFL